MERGLTLVKGKLCALWERQDSLSWRYGEPVVALLGGKNDDSFSCIERIAVRVGPSHSAGRGRGGDAQVPISGIPFEYLLDFYKVGCGRVTVNAGFAGPACGLSNDHHAGVVVLVLRRRESDELNAREGATAWNGATGRTRDRAGGVRRGFRSPRSSRHWATA